MSLHKNNPLLDSIKAKIGAERSPVIAPTAMTLTVVTESGRKAELLGSQEVRDIDTILTEGGFVRLYKVLEAARKEMEMDRKAVYVDEESAEVLDLLKKKAKIKSNVLVSYLLQEFFSRHKALIQELIGMRSNRLLE
jgi:hypothetical protein